MGNDIIRALQRPFAVADADIHSLLAIADHLENPIGDLFLAQVHHILTPPLGLDDECVVCGDVEGLGPCGIAIRIDELELESPTAMDVELLEQHQMLTLKPHLAIMDETDSGLDIDALKVVSKGVNTLRSPDCSTIVVTHYQRLLNYIVPDVVHVLSDGRIVKSGGKELALELEEKGYGWIGSDVQAQVGA